MTRHGGSEQQRIRVVVTGTDTGVGKTVFASGLVAALDGEYWKPIQSGLDGPTDTETVAALSGLPPERFHAEAYRLRNPLAPIHAAEDDRITIDIDRLLTLPTHTHPLVIEGAGGLLVPITDNLTMADLFAHWRAAVILVARTALGTMNHTALSVEALRARAVPIAGIAFVGEANERTETHIAHATGVQRLGRLPPIATLDAASLLDTFRNGFDIARLRSAIVAATIPV